MTLGVSGGATQRAPMAYVPLEGGDREERAQFKSSQELIPAGKPELVQPQMTQKPMLRDKLSCAFVNHNSLAGPWEVRLPSSFNVPSSKYIAQNNIITYVR